MVLKINYYLLICLLFLLHFILMSTCNGENNTENIEYSYDGTNVSIKIEEQQGIHLSLPSDEYIMRLRSIGDFELYLLPKGKNALIDNLFIHECDSAIVTINNDQSLTDTPVCLSGQIVRHEKKPKEKINKKQKNDQNEKQNISLSNQQNIKTGNYSFGQANGEEGQTNHSEKEKKEYSYLIETITEQQIIIKCKNEAVEKQLIDMIENQDKYGSAICGYYIVSKECPYIEVHWLGSRKSFVKLLRNNDMLSKGLFGFW